MRTIKTALILLIFSNSLLAAADVVRCPRQQANQIECDSRDREQLGRGAKSIPLTYQDSASFVELVKGFRNPEVVGEGSDQSTAYKFTSDNKSVFFICVKKGARTQCKLYYNSQNRENTVQIIENSDFANIRFLKTSIVESFSKVFNQNGSKAFVADEVVSVPPAPGQAAQNFRRLTFSCENQKMCELRAVIGRNTNRPPPTGNEPIDVIDSGD
ncbi:MAG: hypothetical protein ACOYOK_06835 [Pseudobdellovibrionaceae bacterium]